MANVKFTKVDKFNAIVSVLNGGTSTIPTNELVDFCFNEIDLLEKKKSRGSKPTANQLQNEEYKNEILDILTTNDRPMTIKEITAEMSNPTLSNQKMTTLITQLKVSLLVERTVVKKQAYFSIVS